jgi:two-component system, LytTR family, sensor kinase
MHIGHGDGGGAIDSTGGTAAADAPNAGVRWPAVLAGWTVLGIVESAAAYVRVRGTPFERSWPEVLVANVPWWLLWAVFTPPILVLVRRAAPLGARWMRGVAVHLVAAVVTASAHLLLEGVVFYYTISRFRGTMTLQRQWSLFFSNYFVLDFVTYWLIVGAALAVTYYARYHTSALRAARLEATAARLELGLAEARVQALRTELNPHFFFNALNSVSGLVRRGENDAAVQMLARLGELLRLTLDRDVPPEIPLGSEIALLDRYLDIERVRFGDRLTVDIGLDPPAEDARVPALILQPLVENAIRHGITKCPGPGRIQILARRAGDALELSVRDTGEGLHPRDLTMRREGIGLSNTRARLAAMYGDGASLRLDNAPGGGALVTLRLPWRAPAGAVAAGA